MSSVLTRAKALRTQVGSEAFDDRIHGTKQTWMELAHGGRNRFLGLFELPPLLLKTLPNRHLRHVGTALRETDASYQPWVPRLLPAQVMRIGPLVLAGMPKEPTTVSGRRIADVVRRGLDRDVGYVVVNGYANGYAGYVTTPEEYTLQRYEGASTLFGEASLPAWCTAFAALLTRMRADTARVPSLSGTVGRDRNAEAPSVPVVP